MDYDAIRRGYLERALELDALAAQSPDRAGREFWHQRAAYARYLSTADDAAIDHALRTTHDAARRLERGRRRR